MVWNVKRIWERPVFVHFRDHDCPGCGGRLEKEKVSRVVHSRSAEAADFDFSAAGDGFLFGKVRFIWTEFRCPSCGSRFRVRELYDIEKGKTHR